jgi:hypothetical protein
VAIDCTTDACEKGTASFDLSFQHVVWTTTNGQADLSGHVVVTTTAGGAYCSASTECHDAGFACNQVSYSNDDSQYPSSACGPTNASGVTLGAPCTSASDCASGYCDLHAGECAMFCSTDADCDDATRCVRSHWDAGVKECMRRCATDASCVDLPQAKRCVGHEAADSTQVVGACGGSTGTTQDGHTPTSAYGGSCETELQLSSNGECTRFCASNADCTAVLPVCGVTGVKRAQGDGTVAYAKACHS